MQSGSYVKIQTKPPNHENTAVNPVSEPRVIILNSEQQQQHFISNYIRTTKYTRYSFIPLALFYQFFRFTNCYFLLVTILQCIPIISPLHPLTAINPMVFVLTVSMIREGYEDYQRYKSDQSKFQS